MIDRVTQDNARTTEGAWNCSDDTELPVYIYINPLATQKSVTVLNLPARNGFLTTLSVKVRMFGENAKWPKRELLWDYSKYLTVWMIKLSTW